MAFILSRLSSSWHDLWSKENDFIRDIIFEYLSLEFHEERQQRTVNQITPWILILKYLQDSALKHECASL